MTIPRDPGQLECLMLGAVLMLMVDGYGLQCYGACLLHVLACALRAALCVTLLHGTCSPY